MSALIRRLPLLLGGLSALAPLSIDMYLPSFPAITRDLALAPGAVEQTLAVFFVGLAIGQIIYGPVTDRFGRKGPLLFGMVLYTLASMMCALAQSVEMLTAMRFAQAIGGCAGMVVSRAVVRDVFDPKDSVRIFALLMLIMGVAPILAPALGGQLLIWFGWRAMFWVLAGFSVLWLVLLMVLLPETLKDENRQQGGVLDAIKAYGDLLIDRRFMGLALCGTLCFISLFAYIGGSPNILMEQYGLTPTSYSIIFGVNAFGLIGLSQASAPLTRRFGMERVLTGCLIVLTLAASVLLLTQMTGFGGLPGLLVPLFVQMSILGMIFPNNAALTMAPFAKRAGMAAALMGAIQFGGGAVAGAAVGALHDGTSRPMAGLIMIGALGALLCYRFMAQPMLRAD